MTNEANVFRKFVVLNLHAARCGVEPHSIVVVGHRLIAEDEIVGRVNPIELSATKRSDYRFRFTGDFPITDADDKANCRRAAAGMQQTIGFFYILPDV